MNRSEAAPEGAEHVPVLIVGGSLVGLSTSLFLGRLGVPHMLVERHSGTSIHPRGRGNNVRTMELFRVAGIQQRIEDAASVLADNHGILQTPTLVGDAGEWLFKEIDPGGGLARFSPGGWCLCSQNDLEPVLLESARELGGDLRFHTELMSFEQDAQGVTAQLKSRDTGEHSTVRADYLVAADGPRSPIRERLSIGQSGPGDLFHNVSITFTSRGLADAVGDRRFIVCYLTNPEADGALLPVDNREHWVFHAPWHPENGETLEEFTDERCTEHIRRATGVPDLDVQITGRAAWHAAERVAERYSDHRVFLAGDSAHEMSPTGAFGSNTGIQDAHNLAWKLAAVLGGWAGPGLLESYDLERRPVAEATSARASTRSVEHSHPGYTPNPEAGGPGGPGAGGPGGKKGGILNVALGYRYPRGAVLGADPATPVVPEGMRLTGEPGSRAPHMWLNRAATRVSTLDLYERSMVLLSSGRRRHVAQRGHGHRATDGRAARLLPHRQWARRGAVPRRRRGLGGDPRCRPGGAVLVRPDGFVAWRSEGPAADPGKELRDALMGVLDRD